MQEHFKLLGFKSRDVITGYEGVVVSISFDISGCIQAFIKPPVKKGVVESGDWFDTKRLVTVGEKPVMTPPDFANPPGGQKLSAPRNSSR